MERHRDVVLTTYKDFLLNYDSYKEKFGKVFFKTKHKNISAEIITVANFNVGEVNLISSDNDTSEEQTTNFNKNVYAVYTNRYSSKRENMMINDFRFSFLKEDDEVFVQPLLHLKKDKKYKHIPVEYRSFVVNGQFITSRSWIPHREVPDEVKEITQNIIDAMPNEMNKTFVVDVLEFIDKKGKSHYDICEINPIISAGYEIGSSIFLLEENLDDKLYHNQEIEEEFKK